MSLVGFKARNHPQQTGRRGASDTVDERITPGWLFAVLDARHGFTLDAAANSANAKCEAFFDLAADGLSRPWAPARVWCNPPYSKLGAWVDKAWVEFRAGCPVIVMLLPANRTEQGWWQSLVEPFRDGRGPITTEFLPRRINFGVPGNEGGRFATSSPFGCVLLTWHAGLDRGAAPECQPSLFGAP